MRRRDLFQRTLLRLYPRSVRREIGDELAEAFDECLRRERARRRWLGPIYARVRLVADTIASVRALRRETRDRRRFPGPAGGGPAAVVAALWLDLRQALRLCRRRPGFTVAAVATLALGIGANVVVFSLVRAVLLRPLPYDDPGRLVYLWQDHLDVPGLSRGILTGQHVRAFRERNTTLSDMAAIQSWENGLNAQVDLVDADGAERLRGALVTPNFFELLGVRPAAGRLFDRHGAADEEAGVAILSDGLWRRRFGADPGVVGRTLALMTGRTNRAARRFTVIGVLPRVFRFTYPRETEIFLLMPWTDVEATRALLYHVVGRVRSGVGPAAVEAEMTAAQQDVTRSYGYDAAVTRRMLDERRIRAETLPERASGEARPGLLLLAGVAALVLVIACINVALLVLSRTAERSRELALRASLGASGGRLIRQLLVEGVVLAGAGGVAAIGLAQVLGPVFQALVPAAIPRVDEMRLDWGVLAFALGVSSLTALACGLAPAWPARSTGLHARARQGGPMSAGRTAARLRQAIVAAQATLLLVLVIGAGLLLRSFWSLQHVDLGYDGAGVLTLEMRLLNSKYWSGTRIDSQAVVLFQDRLIERVRALPGVESAGLSTAVPMRGVDFIQVAGPPGAKGEAAYWRSVDAGFFEVMRLPLRAGRMFTDGDTAAGPRVAIVSQTFARAVFGDANPVGRRLALREDTEIVGVVGDVRTESVRDEAVSAVYVPRRQVPAGQMCLVVRTAGGPAAIAPTIRTLIRELDPEQPVQGVTTLDRIVDETLAPDRFNALSSGAFTAVALAVALAGLVGVVARSVTERARELAIRTALGADARMLVRLVLRQGLSPVALGLAAGLLGAWVVSRLLRGFLFEIAPLDPATWTTAVALLAIVSAAAVYLPARRATRIDPIETLRAE